MQEPTIYQGSNIGDDDNDIGGGGGSGDCTHDDDKVKGKGESHVRFRTLGECPLEGHLS